VILAEKLDGLPPALATDQVAISFADYLRLYEESWLKLQQTSPELDSYEDRALYSTWQLSFDQIKRQNYLSTKLLQWTCSAVRDNIIILGHASGRVSMLKFNF
jgi:hypothetical protein